MSDNNKPVGNGNLIVPTSEQAREYGSRGGIASAESKKRKKTFKELAKAMLDMEVSEKNKEKIAKLFPELEKDEKISYRMAGLAKQIERMLDGDARSFEVLRDTAGEKPIDKQAFTDTEGNPTDNRLVVEFVNAKENTNT